MNTAIAKQSECYTIEDIYNLPDGQRAELIDGELYMMAAPGRIHQRIVMELSFRIRDYIGRKSGDCEVIHLHLRYFCMPMIKYTLSRIYL